MGEAYSGSYGIGWGTGYWNWRACSWEMGKRRRNHYGSTIFWAGEFKSRKQQQEDYEQTVRTRFGENRQKRTLHGRDQTTDNREG